MVDEKLPPVVGIAAAALEASSKVAMDDQLFVEYMARTYPDPKVFANVTSNLLYLHAMYHCWISGRASMSDEFLKAVQENPAATTPNC